MVNQWQDGFQADVTVTAGGSAISGWRVTWTFANGQTITQAWSAEVAQSGGNVTADNMPWNGNLGPGASAAFGFTGTHSGTINAPSVTCTAT